MKEKIKQEIQGIKVGIEKAKKVEDYTLYLQKEENKKYIFSKYDPKKTAIDLVERELDNKEIVWILYGFGLGYITQYLLELLQTQARIFIIEPSEEVFKEELALTSLEELLKRENVHVFTGCDFVKLKYLLMDYIKPEDLNNIKFTILPHYLNAYTLYSIELIRTIKEFIYTLQVNICTLSFYAKDNFSNMCKNFSAFTDSYEIRQHQGKYKDTPAVIVSAGPSLEKNLEQIKDFKGLVFVGGRTVQPVLKQGVTPDFFVSIDAGMPAYHVLGMNKVEGMPLVTVPIGQSKVVESHVGPKYFVNSFMEGINNSLYGEQIERINMGSSVATVCLSLAHYMGCSPIVFIGQDLAFTNNQSHATKIEGSLNVQEKMEGYNYMSVPGFYGEHVNTVENFLTMLRWIEEFIAFCPQSRYINATEGGVYIQGAEHKSFKEVVEETKETIKPTILHTQKLEQSQSLRSIEETLKLMLCVLEEAKALAEKGKKYAKKLKREYEYYLGRRTVKIADLVSKLDYEIDKKLLEEKPGSTILEELFYKAFYEINLRLEYKEPLMENEIQKGIRVAERSIKLYEALEHAIEDGIQITQKIKEEHVYE